jgi:precorrin-3B synthase
MSVRGACPGLSTPMPTGDGLLARLLPAGTIALDAFAGLAVAARTHGNGIVEITARGSIQIRGLTPASASAFADAVAKLGIAANEGVPVVADPLAGLDPTEAIDAGAVAVELRRALVSQPFMGRLAPKVCVVIDGGGRLHLDALSADVRLRAEAIDRGARIHVAVAGNAATAIPISTIEPARAVETVVRLLGMIAAHGPGCRARDVETWVADRRTSFAVPDDNEEVIGIHRLRNDCVAVGIGFAFGHAEASTLEALMEAARDAGATGVRAAPGRALLMIGLTRERVAGLTTAAKALGFIVDPDDLRRRVVACAGAPLCASAEIPARALASGLTTAAALLDDGEIIHVSGCAKGCAHHGPAALTAIGRAGQCDLLVRGAPAGSVAVEALPQILAQLAQRRQRAAHG